MRHIPKALSLALLANGVALAADKPNVLIIYTDEHNYKTIEAYLPYTAESERYPWGEDLDLETPNINYLAENGVLMTGCYASTPVSTPSRASFQTGCYAHKTNCATNDQVLDVTLKTFAEIFQDNGYSTGYIGKWHLSGSAKPGWDPDPNYGWEDNYYMMNRGHYKSVKDGTTSPQIVSPEKTLQDGYDFMTNYLGEKTINFIEENKDVPFLCMVSIPDPHGPEVVTADYYNMYSSLDYSQPESALKDMSLYPAWASGSTVLTDSVMASYWGMVKCVDDNVGYIIESLRENDLMDNTIIIFTSDHGDMLGEHAREDKSVPLESSLKVPFIMYAPNILPQGAAVTEAVSNIDVYPTLVDICGLVDEDDTQVDGISILPLLKGEDGYVGRNCVFSRSTGDDTGWLAATTDRYKLVLTSTTGDAQWLLDREVDPGEYTNFYYDEAYAAIKEELLAKLLVYCEENDEPKLENNQIRVEMGLEALDNEESTDNTGELFEVEGTNLITNGDFEDYDDSTGIKLPVGWDVVQDSKQSTSVNIGSNGIGNSGSLKLGIASTVTNCSASQSITLEEGANYTFAGYCFYSALPTVDYRATMTITSSNGSEIFTYEIPAVGTLGSSPSADDASVVHIVEFNSTATDCVLTLANNGIDKLIRFDNLALWKENVDGATVIEQVVEDAFTLTKGCITVSDQVVMDSVKLFKLDGGEIAPDYTAPNTIDITTLAPSVYIIQAKMNNGDLSILKFIP